MYPSTPYKNPSGFMLPALALFGSLTLLLVLLFAARPVKPVAAPVVNAPVIPATAAPDSALIAEGSRVFRTVCAGCHGPRATGIKGLGKPLVGSVFFNSLSDDDLLKFLQIGRPVNDPLNTTGVAMPARGGRPSLTNDDLRNVIVYLRSLNTATHDDCVGSECVTAAGAN